MNRTALITGLVLGTVLIANAEDFGTFVQKFQVHGNVAQGLLFSSANNYLTTESSNGSAAWDSLSLNVTRNITDKFRVGAQMYSYRLGQFGRQNLMLDWAYGDYRFNSHFGIRAGKVKTPMGLYNDIQDVDAIYPWVLLPQAIYPADTRSFALAHTGAVAYGEVQLGKDGGVLEYAGFGGSRSQPRNEGFAGIMADQGITLRDYAGTVIGADLKWRTPINGLMLGGSWSRVELDSTSSTVHTPFGSFPARVYSRDQTQEVSGQYERGKLTLQAEGRITPIYQNSHTGPGLIYSPMRAWYVLASYRAMKKLTLGTYYDQEWFFLYNRDRQDPTNHLKDVALCTRFDLNRFLYAKVEGHYMDGLGSGFSVTSTNPQGRDRVTHLLVARIGFTF